MLLIKVQHHCTIKLSDWETVEFIVKIHNLQFAIYNILQGVFTFTSLCKICGMMNQTFNSTLIALAVTVEVLALHNIL